MTTITPISSLVVSAIPGGADMSAAAGFALLQGEKGGSFLGMFAALLSAAAPDSDISSQLSADFLSGILDEPQMDLTAGITESEDKLLLKELAHQFLQEKDLTQQLLPEAQDEDGSDEAESSLISLGTLFTPVEAGNTASSGAAEVSGRSKNAALPSAPSLPAQKEEESSTPGKQGNAAAEKVLPPAANLAGKSDAHSSSGKEEKSDFSNFLREASTLGQSKAVNHDVSRATASLSRPVASSAWGERLGEQIVWMTRNGQQQVDLKLNPANLGPLSISLNMEGNKASIHFTVATLEVRQAIEDALPRLREMMAANGVSLGDADVDEQTRREGEAQHMAGERERERLSGQNSEFAENSEGSPDALGQHERNMERESILPSMVHTAPFAYSNGRLGGIDLFA